MAQMHAIPGERVLHQGFHGHDLRRETSETFRTGIIDSMAKETAGGHAAMDETPKADHPVHKYQVGAM